MPAPCAVCADAVIKEAVDQRLQDRMPIREIAKFVGLTKSAIGRHKLHGQHERNAEGVALGVRPIRRPRRSKTSGGTTSRSARSKSPIRDVDAGQAGQNGDALEPRGLLVRASGLLDAAEAILKSAAAKGDDRLALQANREVRASIELCMRAIGMLSGDGTTVLVDMRRQSAALVDSIPLEDLQEWLRQRKSTAAAIAEIEAAPETVDVEKLALPP